MVFDGDALRSVSGDIGDIRRCITLPGAVLYVEPAGQKKREVVATHLNVEVENDSFFECIYHR